MATVTNQLITQAYWVPEISLKIQSYDTMRWYRSPLGRVGYYEPATGPVATPAVLRGIQFSRALTGRRLKLLIHGVAELDLPFVGPDPVDTQAVADAINTATTLVVAEATDSDLEIRTVRTGSMASLEVLASDAAPYLGLVVNEAAVGLDADLPLVAGISEYRYDDYQANPLAWYAVELRNSNTGFSAPRSQPFPSRTKESIPLNQLIACYVRLADLSGRPIEGRRVIVHNVFVPNMVAAAGRSWGIFRQYEEAITDVNGYAEILLVRGATIDFTISGTGFTRRIVVPSIGTAVDLLDPALSIHDEFGIQLPSIDFAIRTS